jgi:tRNA dimethylallyltransferase
MNKRRLIRYVEIAKTPMDPAKRDQGTPTFKPLIIGLTYSKEILCKRIYKRLIERLEKENMIGEVRRLHKSGVAWKRLESFGLEYKFISLYLQNKLTYDEMVEKLNIAIRQFAKQQMTWFKRDKRIKWVKERSKINNIINKFLNKKCSR